ASHAGRLNVAWPNGPVRVAASLASECDPGAACAAEAGYDTTRPPGEPTGFSLDVAAGAVITLAAVGEAPGAAADLSITYGCADACGEATCGVSDCLGISCGTCDEGYTCGDGGRCVGTACSDDVDCPEGYCSA